jgi:hypothetical protein
VNRECEYEEWKEMLKSAYLEHQAHPLTKLKRVQSLDLFQQDDTKDMDEYFQSEVSYSKLNMIRYSRDLQWKSTRNY